MKNFAKNIVLWLAAMTVAQPAFGGEDLGVGFVQEDGTTIVISAYSTDDSNSEVRCMAEDDVCQNAFEGAFASAMNSTNASLLGWFSTQKGIKKRATYRAIQIEIDGEFFRALENSAAADDENRLLWLDPSVDI